MTQDDFRTRQLRWRCRRGMLEIDEILIPFFDNEFANLDEAAQADFEYLLEQPDPNLLAWFMGHETPEDPRIARIISRIRER